MIFRPFLKNTKDRPVIEVPFTAIDKIAEIFAAGLLLGIWALVIAEYTALPDQIAAHFDVNGNVTRYDSKEIIWVIPGILTFTYAMLTIMTKWPHKHNYLITVTENNAEQLYQLSNRLLRFTKISMCLVFGLIIYQIIEVGHNQPLEFGPWLMVISIGLILAPILYFLGKTITMSKA